VTYFPCVALTLALALAACGDQPYRAERAADEACTASVEQRADAGTRRDSDPPWRVTTRTDRERLVANFWIDTPRDAPDPVGDPDYVCEATLGTSEQDPSKVVAVRP
jgi:hypothetical protein